MVKALVIGDPHFKVSNKEDTDALHVQTLAWCNVYRPDLIVCLGDLLDRFETAHFSPLTRATRFMRDLSLRAPTVLIIGNHDRPNNAVYLTDEHHFDPLKSWDNFHVVDTVTEMEIKGKRFVFVPYVAPGRFHEALSNTVLDGIHCIFCHQEFKGCRMGPVVSVDGDVWDRAIPVVSGHIHDYQVIGSVTYVGTPIQHAYGDSEDKGVHLFEFAESVMSTRLSITTKRRVTETISHDKLNEWIAPENCYVRLVVTGPSAELYAVSRSKIFKQLKKQGIKIVLKVTVDAQTKEEIVRLTFDQAMSEILVNDNDASEEYAKICSST